MTPTEAMELNLLNVGLYSTILGLLTWGIWQKVKISMRESSLAKVTNWQNQFAPVAIALIVVYSFYPMTLFTWLPFEPSLPHLAQVYSGLLIGSMSHLEHESIKHLGGFFLGIINRFGGFGVSHNNNAKG